MQVDVELLRVRTRVGSRTPGAKQKHQMSVLGYGEISTIFEIQADSVKDLACRPPSTFQTRDEVERYQPDIP